MTPEMWIAVAGFVVLLLLVFMRVWIGFALIIIGFVGLWVIKDFSFAGNVLSNEPFTQATRFTLTTMPLFSLMGAVIKNSGMGSGLYGWARTMIGHIRGGLGMATVIACGVFAAICGNSQITAMTIGQIAFPEMKKAGYSDEVAAGGIGIGGGIGIMIPPSVCFIVYGIITEQSIGKLFMAGFIPGILQVIIYCIVFFLISRFRPKSAPASPKSTWKERAQTTAKVWPIVVLVFLMLGGIYGGFCTATEAGAIGAVGAIVIALITRQLSRKQFYQALVDGARMTATVMILLIGANVFLRFITASNLTTYVTGMIIGLDVSRYVILLFVILLYLVLGSIFDIMAAILLTVPFLFPIMTGLGFHPIWFGVFIVAMMQIGELTPPIGLTAFVLSDVIDVPVHKVFKGVAPFLLAAAVFVFILCAFPQIALLLQ